MQQILKAILFFTAIIGVIVLGLFWPSDDAYKPDAFTPAGITGNLEALGLTGAPLPLSTVQLHTVYSPRSAIMEGRFRYREADIPWTFTIPIDWGKQPEGLEPRRVVQRLAMADPFLRAFEDSGDEDAFRQAAFFFLDWQSYHQTGRRITPHSWDADAAEGRMARLAYILSAAESNPELLPTNSTQSLIALADFHIRRAADPVYGFDTNPAESPAVQSLCAVLDKLPSCPLRSLQ